MIFADDIQILLSCLPSELDRGINLIAHDVGVIADYASNNGLKLNLAKSKAIILGSLCKSDRYLHLAFYFS